MLCRLFFSASYASLPNAAIIRLSLSLTVSLSALQHLGKSSSFSCFFVIFDDLISANGVTSCFLSVFDRVILWFSSASWRI